VARVRQSDLIVELAEICREIGADLVQRMGYYRASAYKSEAARQINMRVDQLRAIFQVLGDEDLSEAMADHDAILDQGAQMLAAGECTLTARITILMNQLEPALGSLVRRYNNQEAPLKDDTIKILLRHRNTLKAVCREGSRSWEILRGL
jgi:hypothetical protein